MFRVLPGAVAAAVGAVAVAEHRVAGKVPGVRGVAVVGESSGSGFSGTE